MISLSNDFGTPLRMDQKKDPFLLKWKEEFFFLAYNDSNNFSPFTFIILSVKMKSPQDCLNKMALSIIPIYLNHVMAISVTNICYGQGKLGLISIVLLVCMNNSALWKKFKCSFINKNVELQDHTKKYRKAFEIWACKESIVDLGFINICIRNLG